jgi:hypothetical protein
LAFASSDSLITNRAGRTSQEQEFDCAQDREGDEIGDTPENKQVFALYANGRAIGRPDSPPSAPARCATPFRAF